MALSSKSSWLISGLTVHEALNQLLP